MLQIVTSIPLDNSGYLGIQYGARIVVKTWQAKAPAIPTDGRASIIEY